MPLGTAGAKEAELTALDPHGVASSLALVSDVRI
jgi:hypothetical protein